MYVLLLLINIKWLNLTLFWVHVMGVSFYYQMVELLIEISAFQPARRLWFSDFQFIQLCVAIPDLTCQPKPNPTQ